MIKKMIYIALVAIALVACEKNFPTWEEFNTNWLEENSEKLGEDPEVDSVFVLPTGVQCEVYHRGYGAIPKPSVDPTTGLSSYIEVKYTGMLPDGDVFDSSDSTTTSFYLGDCIPGWQQVLSVMPQGSHIKAYIPASEGYNIYGSKDAYDNYVVPPHSTLIFDIELVNVINY